MALIDSYTKLLLHCNGTDGSTTFTDSGNTGHTVTAHGDAQLDTSEKKFGTASGLFGGIGDYLSVPDHNDWYFGTGDFTIDFWIYILSLTTNHYLYGQSGASPSPANVAVNSYVNSSGKLASNISNGSTIYNTGLSTDTLTTDIWYHIAIVRNGTSFKQYIGGVGNGEYTLAGGFDTNDASSVFSIGRVGDLASVYFDGHIDEFRVSKGIARWTSNFTPPTREYGAKRQRIIIL